MTDCRNCVHFLGYKIGENYCELMPNVVVYVIGIREMECEMFEAEEQ